ncbi:MAG: hypothetical protein JWP85_1938 [Rhodoglobus sp.]|nr:hypothetical protein [Rhodoglobus sp.]
MSNQQVIALISATPIAIGPATSSLARILPDASVWNILDDRLLIEAKEAGGLTPSLSQRMDRLIDHAVREGADGILLTCSMYGPVAHQHASPGVPILAADDAAFDLAATGGYRRILVVASFEAALTDAVDRLRAHLDSAGSSTELTSVVAEGVLEAQKAGDDDAHHQALADACRAHLDGADAVLLAQFSLAPVAARLSATLGVPVISGPDAAAAVLKSRLRTHP